MQVAAFRPFCKRDNHTVSGTALLHTVFPLPLDVRRSNRLPALQAAGRRMSKQERAQQRAADEQRCNREGDGPDQNFLPLGIPHSHTASFKNKDKID